MAEEFSRLLSACDLVIAAGIHVVVTAHAKMRKFEQPDEMGAYDRWEMKLSKQTAPLLKEWCDILLLNWIYIDPFTYDIPFGDDIRLRRMKERIAYHTDVERLYIIRRKPYIISRSDISLTYKSCQSMI